MFDDYENNIGFKELKEGLNEVVKSKNKKLLFIYVNIAPVLY